MNTPEEEALVGPIVAIVTGLLEGVLNEDAGAVARKLSAESVKRVGLSIFGLDAVAIPMGLAAKPHQMGLSSVEVAAELAVVEVRGRDADERDVSVCSVILGGQGKEWRVEDIWPVPADTDFSIDAVLEPTVLFYNGQAQLAVANPENLDAVEALLVPGLQTNGMGLHIIEQGVRLWRSFSGGAEAPEDAAAWAAGTHLAILALDEANPEPEELAAQYHVPLEMVITCFMEIAARLGLEMEEAEKSPPIVERPTGLIDASGRPIGPSGGTPGSRGGIILPGG